MRSVWNRFALTAQTTVPSLTCCPIAATVTPFMTSVAAVVPAVMHSSSPHLGMYGESATSPTEYEVAEARVLGTLSETTELTSSSTVSSMFEEKPSGSLSSASRP